MAYFPDLTPYSYFADRPPRLVELNIGWLRGDERFRVCEPSGEFLERLWNFSKISVYVARVFHLCPFCLEEVRGTIYKYKDEYLSLGSAEIRVFSNRWIAFAAPNLIFHYAFIHHYAPPKEFVAAVLEGPQPSGKEYFEQLDFLGRRWSRRFAGHSEEEFRVIQPPRSFGGAESGGS